jgi:hypothetical protein
MATPARPLGTASSHGCICPANAAIDWLVHTIGPTQLPGTPVQIDYLDDSFHVLHRSEASAAHPLPGVQAGVSAETPFAPAQDEDQH